ncbi:MAG TPA: flagellar type III secretion system pore protein FliP [Haliangiales bacterium]|nr:flagellar type III secretion system pore protein FliP [Haliangiales bacterium]
MNPAAVAASPSSALQMVVVLAIASLLPAIVLTCTCFARFLVVFSFLKNGLGTQGAPPNQVLVGLALFMTMFVMAPVATRVHEQALKPYLDGKKDEGAAIDAAGPAIKDFLLPRTRQEDLALFYDVSGTARPATAQDVPLRIAIPAFVLTELRTAFQMGLAVLLPFLVIDLIVATVLSSLGMVMLPPVLVSLPVKLLIFVAVDGWHLLVGSLLRGVIA